MSALRIITSGHDSFWIPKHHCAQLPFAHRQAQCFPLHLHRWPSSTHACLMSSPLSTYRCQEGLWGYGGRMYLLEIIQCIHPSPPYDKETRWFMEGDYQLLSASTTNDRYPVPRIQDFNAILDGCTLFLKIDLWKGYHQFLVVAEDIHKMAVSTPFGLLEFVHMPFGLSNAGETFLWLKIISCEASPLHVCLPEWHSHCISQWGETCYPSQANDPSISREWFGD